MNTHSISGPALDNFLAEHRALMASISDLREMWNQVTQIGRGPQFDEMACGVRKLRDTLTHHFAEEERDGYLKSAFDKAPRLAVEADGLLQQHAEFTETLDNFIRRLTAHEFKSWDDVLAELEAFLKLLRQHEAQENRIMQSAFNTDLGCGD